MRLFGVPKPSDEHEQAEVFKHRLSVRLLFLDKLLLAFLFLALGYVLNRSLEAYRASLQVGLEQFKADQVRRTEELKADQTRRTEELKSDQARRTEEIRLEQEQAITIREQAFRRELATLSRNHERELEVLRGQHARQMETLRVVLEGQGQLTARRVEAYQAIWAALADLQSYVAHIPITVFQTIQEDAYAPFKEKFRSYEHVLSTERVFLDLGTLKSLDEIRSALLWVTWIKEGQVSTKRTQADAVQEAYELLTNIDNSFRHNMETAVGVTPDQQP